MSGAPNAQLTVPLERIASCFEGIIPSAIATVGTDGMPNVTYLSVVQRLDPEHVALSRQFFKKTDANTVANPLAEVELIEPETGRQFKLDLVYQRTETAGPLFERMRTKLDAVAAYEGMANIFSLRGVDICRVTACEPVPCESAEGPERRDISIEKVEAASRRVADAGDMEELLQIGLDACKDLLGCPNVFIMLADPAGGTLYTVASTGYTASGAGSEVPMGEGVCGLAASRRQTIRMTQLARDLTYSFATRESARREPGANSIERVIPLPSLPSIQSQMVAPMLAHRELAGVICAQSPLPGVFQSADECALGILANQIAMALTTLRSAERPIMAEATASEGRALQVKHYKEDDSIFVDNEYLIKGVAGGILWKLLRQYQAENRSEFSNKEIRLDQSLELPDIKDNLEARLILLRKRLEERCEYLRIERVARGRFRLVVNRPLALTEGMGGSPI